MPVSRQIPVSRRRLSLALAAGGVVFISLSLATAAEAPSPPSIDPLLGQRVQLKARWVGEGAVTTKIPILVLAGHADSQKINGSGTSGAAVDLHGARPMDPRMRDELFWNFQVRDAVVKHGQTRGLKISAYTPPALTIRNGDHPSTNWSTGRQHAAKGGYAFEIHFDAYGSYGYGSGLIPAIHKHPNSIDESLAASFGRYPINFRGGLGAPRRGISILEIGKLEGNLEQRLRSVKTRQATLDAIARRITDAILNGMPPASSPIVNSQPDAADTVPPETDLRTSSEDE